MRIEDSSEKFCFFLPGEKSSFWCTINSGDSTPKTSKLVIILNQRYLHACKHAKFS